jgi:acetoin utilization protein AcuB
MNLFAPVSDIMTSQLYTVSSEDNLATVKEIFDKHRIHHVPVVHVRQLVGMISKSDFENFLGGVGKFKDDQFIANARLEHTKAKDIMISKLAKVESTDRINVVVEVFCKNLFHALPVVDNDELVGIVTPFDILKMLREEKPVHPEDVYNPS